MTAPNFAIPRFTYSCRKNANADSPESSVRNVLLVTSNYALVLCLALAVISSAAAEEEKISRKRDTMCNTFSCFHSIILSHRRSRGIFGKSHIARRAPPNVTQPLPALLPDCPHSPSGKGEAPLLQRRAPPAHPPDVASQTPISSKSCHSLRDANY